MLRARRVRNACRIIARCSMTANEETIMAMIAAPRHFYRSRSCSSPLSPSLSLSLSLSFPVLLFCRQTAGKLHAHYALLDRIRPLGADRLHRARFTGNVSFQSAIGEQPVAPQPAFFRAPFPPPLLSRVLSRGCKNPSALRLIAIPGRAALRSS